MKVILLKDLSEDCVDAVIVANTSTTEDIENAISKAKENPDYQWDDLLKSLPSDCILYDKWNDLETVYY
jgi:hypothetical protein